MFSLLRNRLGVPGVLAIVAVVFAMAGGAYAANKVIITSINQIKPSVRNQLKGAVGPAGPQGSPGAKGDAGSAGASGKNGTSTTTAAFVGSKGACEHGGVEVNSASPAALVCNGETGFTETLPSEETETGVWAARLVGEENTTAEVYLSFNIPLSDGIAASDIELLKNGDPSTANCPGTKSNPEAAPGKFCVYTSEELGGFTHLFLDPSQGFVSGAGATGSILQIEREPAEENAIAIGTWAVTAP